jgi:hypothetical protein
LILRAIPSLQSDISEAAELHPKFTFVGDCYVHGIMDGERAPASAPNSIPVLKDTPHFVIPYRFLRTGAVSSISL